MSQAKRVTPPRYDRYLVSRRVEAARVDADLTMEELAREVGLSKAQWYKRIGSCRDPFTVEELARIADALGAPPLWPFADWDPLEKLARNPRVRDALTGTNLTGPIGESSPE